MKNKKILFILFGCGIAMALGGALITFAFDKGGYEYESYEKYSLAISIDGKRNDAVDSHLIDVSYDGESARINSSKVNKDSYIIGERIYYLEEDTFYWYRVEESYLDIYSIISSYSRSDLVREADGTAHYSAVIEASKVNALLVALFIEEDVSSPMKVSYTVVDDKIENFSIRFTEFLNYDEVNIDIVVKRLEDDYTVNTSRIFGSVGGGRRYKIGEATTNLFKLGENL